MRKRIEYLLVVLASISCIGCLKTYYPAIYQASSYPMIYQTNDSTNEASQYYSADVVISKGDYQHESLQLVKGSYIIVKTDDHLNINPKIFGYAGKYNVSGLGKYDGDKMVFGFGGEISSSLNFKIKSFKMGLGVNLGLASEFGEYYEFRKNARSDGQIVSEQKLVFLTFSAFPVFTYEFSESLILSTQANVGIPGLLSPSIVLNNDGYVYWLSWIPDYEKKQNYLGHRLVLGFMINADKF